MSDTQPLPFTPPPSEGVVVDKRTAGLHPLLWECEFLGPRECGCDDGLGTEPCDYASFDEPRCYVCKDEPDPVGEVITESGHTLIQYGCTVCSLAYGDPILPYSFRPLAGEPSRWMHSTDAACTMEHGGLTCELSAWHAGPHSLVRRTP